jgi:hypothetical protein
MQCEELMRPLRTRRWSCCAHTRPHGQCQSNGRDRVCEASCFEEIRYDFADLDMRVPGAGKRSVGEHLEVLAPGSETRESSIQLMVSVRKCNARRRCIAYVRVYCELC